MDNNMNISITNPQPEVRGFEENYLTGTWLFLWSILIIVFVLIFIIRKDTSVSTSPMPIFLPNGVQTNLHQDKLYITNGTTGLVSVVDTKTDQLKTILPFC
ncbi:hypothetical protein CN553_26110 [Bacillus cereus]|uniref:Uncharacterized protein n=1 Tax=Bacillus cereus TaxID=1396 RepID=A0A9X6U7S0_BACCE|nr:hypothetical protein [Bacillus cereus]PEN86068.1 hypothetical protein CN553_26110 [Bacillus cereus]